MRWIESTLISIIETERFQHGVNLMLFNLHAQLGRSYTPSCVPMVYPTRNWNPYDVMQTAFRWTRRSGLGILKGFFR